MAGCSCGSSSNFSIETPRPLGKDVSHRRVPLDVVASPPAAIVYLYRLDEVVTQTGYQMVGYAADFVILCRAAGAQGTFALVH